jgi:hypothetical protein
MTPFTLVHKHPCFGGPYYLHLQGSPRRVNCPEKMEIIWGKDRIGNWSKSPFRMLVGRGGGHRWNKQRNKKR